MSLYWEYAGNDIVASKGDLVFRLHEKYVTVKGNYRDTEYQTYQLQIRKQDNISFKDLGYTFYMSEYTNKINKSVDKETWNNISEVAAKSDDILEVLGFIY